MVIIFSFYKLNDVVHDNYTRQKQSHVLLGKPLQMSKYMRCSTVKITNYMVEHMYYNYSYVSFQSVMKRHLSGNNKTHLHAVQRFYFTLCLRSICMCIRNVKYTYCYHGNMFCDGKHPLFLYHVHVPSNVTKVCEYDKHVCIDMALYVLHISTVVYSVKWLAFSKIVSHISDDMNSCSVMETNCCIQIR